MAWHGGGPLEGELWQAAFRPRRATATGIHPFMGYSTPS
jgi:hypothetical protein